MGDISVLEEEEDSFADIDSILSTRSDQEGTGPFTDLL